MADDPAGGGPGDGRWRDSDDGGDGSDDGDGGDGWLSSLLTALERLDDLSESDRRTRGRTSVNYDVSIGSLEDLIDERRARRGGLDGDEGRQPRGGLGGDEDRRRRDRRRLNDRSPGDGLDDRSPDRERRVRSTTNRFHATTRREDDEVVVTADVASADRDDVTVGFSDAAIVVAVDGEAVERADVPWDDPDADAAVRNGVLTVRVRSGSRSTDADGGADTGSAGGDEERGDDRE